MIQLSIFTLAALLAFAYLAAWIIHGQLIRRIKNTHYYVTKCRYGFLEAWHFTGKTI